MAVKPDLSRTEEPKQNKGIVKFADIVRNTNVQEQFRSLLKERAPQFLASVLNVVNASEKLALVAQNNSVSILKAASAAAALDLPVNPNLGFAYIIPYGSEAQFQMGYKGYIQLAIRTGEYTRMSVSDVHANQFKSWNALTEELNADLSLPGSGEIIGFAFYFKMRNGFEKTAFGYKDKLIAHGKRFSKAFNNGPWQSDPDAMCKKTLVKATLSKWGFMSIQMQTAMRVDQAVIRKDNLDEPGALDYEAPTEPAKEPEKVAPVIDLPPTNPPGTPPPSTPPPTPAPKAAPPPAKEEEPKQETVAVSQKGVYTEDELKVIMNSVMEDMAKTKTLAEATSLMKKSEAYGFSDFQFAAVRGSYDVAAKRITGV